MRRCALLLILICALAVGRTAPALAADAAETQTKAVEALKELGAVIVVDAKSPGKPPIRLMLKGDTVTDKCLDHVLALSKLQEIEFNDTAVSGAGVKRLKGLPNLRDLILRNSILDDDDLENLEELTNIRKLTMNDNRITGSGLKYLKKLSKLKYLHLGELLIIGTII